MIIVTNLKGEPIVINDDLIERVEGDNETYVTLTSGASYIVAEPLEEVVRRSRQSRAEVLAMAQRLIDGAGAQPGEGTSLRLLGDPEAEEPDRERR